MVRYLSKFVLEVLPSVVATVIGAWIVSHYINPKAETPKTEITAPAQGEAKDPADTTDAVDAKTADAKPTDAKPTDTKPADAKAETAATKTDTAKTDIAKTDIAKAKDVDSKSRAGDRPEAAAKPDARKPEEKRDAMELARAAIERLRGSTVDTPAPANTTPAPPQVRAPVETARADESVRVVVPAPWSQRGPAVVPASTTGTVTTTQTAPAANVVPLPPPVIVAAPYGRHSVGPEVVGAVVPAEQASADRPTPPAEIPLQRGGYDLQAQAAPVEHVSIADHVLSPMKSFFRAIAPNRNAEN
jgi:hypothetical protein